MEVFSHKYNLVGKIDLYDQESSTLIERKTKIKHVYDGYRYQMYAQKLALEEMGYPVDSMILHSLDDNRKYPVAFGGRDMYAFEKILTAIRSFDLAVSVPHENKEKCTRCIYHELCRK
jgi:CRISPR-associated protein Cas4